MFWLLRKIRTNGEPGFLNRIMLMIVATSSFQTGNKELELY